MNQKSKTKRVLYWAPRIAGILFAVFISLFALDVFGEGYTGWELLFALVMHLIPTFIVIFFLLLAWKWEWIGAVAFSILGVYYIVMTQGRFHLTTYLVISGPLFITGILFLISWLTYRSEDILQAE
jgi:hypothetical protein